jgi:glutathione S-transferase
VVSTAKLRVRSSLTKFLVSYFGQADWFVSRHHEKIPSAIERYQNEIRRIFGVLEGLLEGKQWLVGDKVTFADLAFLPYNDRVERFLTCPAENRFDGFPNVKAWHEKMTSRPSWTKAMKTRDLLMDEQGLMPNGMPKGVSSP